MKPFSRISIAVAALAMTAGAASAQCADRHNVMAADPPAEATPVDVATLLPPVLPSPAPADATDQPEAPPAQ